MKTYREQEDRSLVIVHEDGKTTTIPVGHRLCASAQQEVADGEAEIIGYGGE